VADVSAPDRPAVDVIIATRDRPELLRRAIEAVLAQRYDGALAVTVVFDQSEPDPTLAVDDARRSVRVTTNTRTPGLPGARNTGITSTSNPLVAFCDDDDVWLPAKVAAQVAVLDDEPGVELVTTGIFVVAGTSVTPRVIDGGWVTQADLARSRVLEAHPSTFLFRRSAVEGIGLVDEELPGGYAEDYEWLLRAAARHPVAAVPLPLAEVHWHRSSFFADRWRMIIDALDELVAKHPELRTDAKGLARIQGQQAFAHASLGDRAAARRTAVEALRSNPAEARAYLALAVSTGAVSSPTVLKALQAFGRSV
jgi:glycosyltransferase involved in cell wall biosynthesis